MRIGLPGFKGLAAARTLSSNYKDDPIINSLSRTPNEGARETISCLLIYLFAMLWRELTVPCSRYAY